MRRIIVVGLDALGSRLSGGFMESGPGQDEFEIKNRAEVEMNLAAKSSGPEFTHKGKRVAQWKVESAKRGGAR